MKFFLERLRGNNAPRTPPQFVSINYTSAPVDIPSSFLGPLEDPSQMKVATIDFASTVLPEYIGQYAVVLDGVLSRHECTELLRMAEESAGGSGDAAWQPALVSVDANREILMPLYRNSDRIIWDQEELVRRLWARIMQGEGMKEQFEVMEGERYVSVMGSAAVEKHDRWIITPNGLNERMRFLKYGAGQFFRPHCDAAYRMPNGQQMSFYTFHLYLNDSAQELEKKGPEQGLGEKVETINAGEEPLRGGATKFHSHDEKRGLDIDPKIGRVLIFQHKKLLHSGDDVVAGVKYTMRSDVMYELEGGDTDKGDGVFEN